MTHPRRKTRVALISPFLDKRHGTERIVIEWFSHLPDGFEIHVYSHRVEDWDPTTFVFHRIPKMPGPHLFGFLWWLVANRVRRFWDRRCRGLNYDLVFSPGINCLDADVISVHIVFAEFLRQARAELDLSRNPIWFWPRLLHRRIYYRLITTLERHIYPNREMMLVLYAKKTAEDLARFYGRRDPMPVLYLGLDHGAYNQTRRTALRSNARAHLGLSSERFTLLLVGNDLHKKGISALLDAVAILSELPITLLVAGSEAPAAFESLARDKKVADRVLFLPLRRDVEFYYAAADVYTGPSLEDTFALPPQEAMACGLPTIVSSTNGTCEIVTDGVDGFILADPTDASSLASIIRRLYNEPDLRRRMGIAAATTALQFTWDRNARDLADVFEQVLRRKAARSANPPPQES